MDEDMFTIEELKRIQYALYQLPDTYQERELIIKIGRVIVKKYIEIIGINKIDFENGDI